jgi:exodeoxyribonuclease V alpha subunit
VLQAVLNPGNDELAAERYGVRFKPGDKVVHLKNKDMSVIDLDQYRKTGFGNHGERPTYARRIFNGNVGVIDAVDQEDEVLYVHYPMDDGDIVVRYDFTQLADILNLAYCLSVHKAQGNEYREVVIPISSQHFIMLTSKWMYTAITRTREKATLIGQAYLFEEGLQSKDETKRRTGISVLSLGSTNDVGGASLAGIAKTSYPYEVKESRWAVGNSRCYIA